MCVCSFFIPFRMHCADPFVAFLRTKSLPKSQARTILNKQGVISQMISQFETRPPNLREAQRLIEAQEIQKKDIKLFEYALSHDEGQIRTVRKMILKHPSWINKCLVIHISYKMTPDNISFAHPTIQKCSLTTASGTHFMLPQLKSRCRSYVTC